MDRESILRLGEAYNQVVNENLLDNLLAGTPMGRKYTEKEMEQIKKAMEKEDKRLGAGVDAAKGALTGFMDQLKPGYKPRPKNGGRIQLGLQDEDPSTGIGIGAPGRRLSGDGPAPAARGGGSPLGSGPRIVAPRGGVMGTMIKGQPDSWQKPSYPSKGGPPQSPDPRAEGQRFSYPDQYSL